MVTTENCFEKVIELTGAYGGNNLKQKSAQWKIVFNWCMENGMQPQLSKSSIENVICFLSQFKK